MDSAWAHRRRTRFTFIVGAVVVVFLALYVVVKTYKPPSCFDDTRNQGELGVDCGGPCELMCQSQVEPLYLIWARAFEIDQGVYSLVAYADNPNFNAYADVAPYRFVLYDKDNFVITEETGETYVTGEPVVPVFVGPVRLENKEPVRVFFEWTELPQWRNEPPKRRVTIEERTITTPNFGSEITAVIKNNEPVDLRDIEVVVIVYDRDDNAIAASQTLVEYLGPRDTAQLVFSWPRAFTKSVGRIEFVPRVPDQER